MVADMKQGIGGRDECPPIQYEEVHKGSGLPLMRAGESTDTRRYIKI